MQVYGDQFLNPNSAVPSRPLPAALVDGSGCHERRVWGRRSCGPRVPNPPPAPPPSPKHLAGLRASPDGRGAVQRADPDTGLGPVRAWCRDRCPSPWTRSSEMRRVRSGRPRRYPAAKLARLPPIALAVATGSGPASLERARTVIERSGPGDRGPSRSTSRTSDAARRQAQQYQQLADVVILASLPVAGCSLAVSVGGGLSERRRRSACYGCPGFRSARCGKSCSGRASCLCWPQPSWPSPQDSVAAALFLRSQLGYALMAPGVEYYVVLGGGLLAALAILASTMPLLRRLTGPEMARNG